MAITRAPGHGAQHGRANNDTRNDKTNRGERLPPNPQSKVDQDRAKLAKDNAKLQRDQATLVHLKATGQDTTAIQKQILQDQFDVQRDNQRITIDLLGSTKK